MSFRIGRAPRLKDTETPVKFGGFTPAEADANLAAVRAVLDKS
jgi:hypothetical protein